MLWQVMTVKQSQDGTAHLSFTEEQGSMISSLAAILASTPSVILLRYTMGVFPGKWTGLTVWKWILGCLLDVGLSMSLVRKAREEITHR